MCLQENSQQPVRLQRCIRRGLPVRPELRLPHTLPLQWGRSAGIRATQPRIGQVTWRETRGKL